MKSHRPVLLSKVYARGNSIFFFLKRYSDYIEMKTCVMDYVYMLCVSSNLLLINQQLFCVFFSFIFVFCFSEEHNICDLCGVFKNVCFSSVSIVVLFWDYKSFVAYWNFLNEKLFVFLYYYDKTTTRGEWVYMISVINLNDFVWIIIFCVTIQIKFIEIFVLIFR